MRLALIGYGAMGQLVATTATRAGDEIGCKVTSDDGHLTPEQLAGKIVGCEVAIDFSVAESVARNVEACALAGLPVVEGTTGWKNDEPAVRRLVVKNNGALVYGANFSIGVN